MDKAKVAIEARELFRKWVSTLSDEDVDRILGVPPKSRRQGKVEELSRKFLSMMAHAGKNWTDELAEAALEWVERQIVEPTSRSWIKPESDIRCGYDVAVADIRKNLGLDQ